MADELTPEQEQSCPNCKGSGGFWSSSTYPAFPGSGMPASVWIDCPKCDPLGRKRSTVYEGEVSDG